MLNLVIKSAKSSKCFGRSYSGSILIFFVAFAEDLMFQRASEFARAKKIPRIYIAANSGARIGIAHELLSIFRVAWEDVHDPEKGFKYL